MNRCIASLAALMLAAAPLAAQDLTSAPRPPEAATARPPRSLPQLPETFGTSRVTYVQVPANAFLPLNSTQTYVTANFGLGPRWTTAGPHDLLAPLSLPAGAQIVYLELDYVDTTAVSQVYGALAVCTYLTDNCTLHPATAAGPPDCQIAGFICSGEAAAAGAGGVSADLSADGLTVSTFTKSYFLVAEPQTSDGSTEIAGMIVGYVLQVSPAPALASFNDVPSNDFGFQYIEALKLSGITGGCQAVPPLYCPDSFVTRRQMAIFLAKALGLQWPFLIF